jgi:hypothetical protein
MNDLYLKPGEGRRVRKPDGLLLDAEGEFVSRETYWLRRLDDGDVVEADPPKPARAAKGADA